MVLVQSNAAPATTSGITGSGTALLALVAMAALLVGAYVIVPKKH